MSLSPHAFIVMDPYNSAASANSFFYHSNFLWPMMHLLLTSKLYPWTNSFLNVNTSTCDLSWTQLLMMSLVTFPRTLKHQHLFPKPYVCWDSTTLLTRKQMVSSLGYRTVPSHNIRKNDPDGWKMIAKQMEQIEWSNAEEKDKTSSWQST